MTPFYEAAGVTVYHGDALDVLATLEAQSFDGVLCDPPYGLKFMGKDWDRGVPGVAFWAGMLRANKPGAMLLAFGGTRTHHRLMCAIEDAGYELRDVVCYLYGSGFPKGHNIAKSVEKKIIQAIEEQGVEFTGWLEE